MDSEESAHEKPSKNSTKDEDMDGEEENDKLAKAGNQTNST